MAVALVVCTGAEAASDAEDGRPEAHPPEGLGPIRVRFPAASSNRAWEARMVSKTFCESSPNKGLGGMMSVLRFRLIWT